MKKLILGMVALFLVTGASFAQPVSDNEVIPVSVTLNSVLRLNIVRGGNIEFVVNNIDQYKDGIPNADQYDTRFTVASSVDFDVRMFAEDATLLGTDDPTNTMTLDNIGYAMTNNGTYVDGTNFDFINAGGVTPLTNVAATDIVTGIPFAAGVGGNAGDVTENDFTINWEMGTQAAGLNATSLLKQSLTPDRYVTNVFLVVEAH